MKNYDGWTLKVFLGGRYEPYIVSGYFHETRSEVIKEFEKTFGSWRGYRRGGHYKMVKVKLIEVT